MYKEDVGDDHPSTLMAMNNMALCFVVLSDAAKGFERLNFLEEARMLAAETLEKRRKEHGKGNVNHKSYFQSSFINICDESVFNTCILYL